MMLASARLFADETVVPVLDPGRGRTKQGYFWAIARDDRPWGGSAPPAVVYSYAPGRGHIHAHALLGGYRGVLQCDGYPAYKKLVAGDKAGPNKAGPKPDMPAVTLAFCWSHVRRGFYDEAKGGTARSRLKPCSALRHSTRSTHGSAARVRPNGLQRAKPKAARWLQTCARGSTRNWVDCLPEVPRQKRSATR